jgi:hypothetical protein
MQRTLAARQTAAPVADGLVTDHPEAGEHDASQDQGEDDAPSPTPSAARSAAAVAAPAAAAPIASVSSVSAVTAVSAKSASTAITVQHDEIPRVPGRYRTTSYGFAEDSHGRMQTARGRPL